MPPRHNNFQGLFEYEDGQWGIDCRLHGKRVRRKIGKLSEARDYLRDLKAAERQGQVEVAPRAVRRRTLGEWVEQYLTIPRGETDEGFATRWAKRVGHLYPEQLRLEDVRTWAHGRLDAGLAVASVHRELATLRSVYSEAIRSTEITLAQSPFRDFRALALPKIRNERQQYVDPDLVPRLIEELGPWWDYAEFSILTGLRISNQAGLKWTDIDWLSQLAHVWRTKADRYFPVQLCDRAIQLLKKQYAKWDGKSEYCWPNSHGGKLDKDHFRLRVWGPAFERAGVKVMSGKAGRNGLTWHDLRHTTATWMAQSGVDLFTVGGLLDHSDGRTTKRYAKHSETRGRTALKVIEGLLLKNSQPVQKPSISLPEGAKNCPPVTV